jgi:pyridoxine/pyridoxamine 5'-phosphate oxidase
MSDVTRATLLQFLERHRLAVVSTISPEATPQAAVVGYAITSAHEIIFDTLGTSRKCRNLRRNPKIAMVVGWDAEITVQLEGIADEPTGAERDRIQAAYFAAYPDGRDRLQWPGITHFRVRSTWARYSDFAENGSIVEFDANQLES